MCLLEFCWIVIGLHGFFGVRLPYFFVLVTIAVLGRRIWSLIFDFILHFIGNFLLLDIICINRNSCSWDFLFYLYGKGRIDRKCGQVVFFWYQSKNSSVGFQVSTAKSVEIHWNPLKAKNQNDTKTFFSKHIFFSTKHCVHQRWLLS